MSLTINSSCGRYCLQTEDKSHEEQPHCQHLCNDRCHCYYKRSEKKLAKIIKPTKVFKHLIRTPSMVRAVRLSVLCALNHALRVAKVALQAMVYGKWNVITERGLLQPAEAIGCAAAQSCMLYFLMTISMPTWSHYFSNESIAITQYAIDFTIPW